VILAGFFPFFVSSSSADPAVPALFQGAGFFVLQAIARQENCQ
jgi:hypothetical protein